MIQGSTLSPVLFILYLDDFVQNKNEKTSFFSDGTIGLFKNAIWLHLVADKNMKFIINQLQTFQSLNMGSIKHC